MQRTITGGTPNLQQMLTNPVRKKTIPQLQAAGNFQGQRSAGGETKEKCMRLRGKMRILQNAFLRNADIVDRDLDVVFICGDGGKVRAHKVILITASTFFNDIFKGQPIDEMSVVNVPDISSITMNIIVLLTYKESVTLTKKQMRDVALHLDMFGMDLKSFVFNESNLADQSGVRNPSVRRPPPMAVRPNPSRQPIPRQIGNVTISGASRPVLHGADDDPKFQGRNTQTPPPLNKIRSTPTPIQLLLKKGQKVPAGIANFRRIAPKPSSTDDLPLQPAMNMTVGNQEIQFEDNGEDDGQVLDPEQGRLMIQEWMKNVGQSEFDDASGSSRSRGSSPQPQRNQCLICNNIFENPEKWRWHESHHVGLGIFKCAYCDELFSTSRKVFQHEMMEHGVSGSGTSLDDPPGIPSDFQIVQGRKRRFNDDPETNQESSGQIPRMTIVRTANGQHRKITTGSPGLVSKKVLMKYSRKPGTSTPSSATSLLRSSVEIGKHTEEEDSTAVDARKIKQLHWVHVCNNCQNCSDSLGKAQLHYEKCFADQSIPFEESATKFRQGFFGRFRCPICPRRYTTNHGFTIHCGHMHNDFRRKFQHVSQNDTLACVSCRKKFDLPSQFHVHLGDDGECFVSPDYSTEDTNTKWIGNEMPGEKNLPGSRKCTSSRSPSGKGKACTTNTGRVGMESQARSTRLANRRTMTREAEISELAFVSVECPICGSEVDKVIEHINREHADMELNISRISDSALRCLKCEISFAIPDLVSHDTYCCIRSKEFQHVKERKLHQPKDQKDISAVSGDSIEQATFSFPVSSNGLNPNIPIPDGVGQSPIDRMEYFDELLDPKFLRTAMKCGVCGNTNAKLRTISECLKSHGIQRCSLCLNAYRDKPTYTAHIRSVHTTGNGNLKCPICQRSQFVNAGQVAGHMLNNHWQPIFKQIFQSGRLLASIPSRQTQHTSIVPRKEEENSTALPIDTSCIEDVKDSTVEQDGVSKRQEDSEHESEVEDVKGEVSQEDRISSIFDDASLKSQEIEQPNMEFDDASKKNESIDIGDECPIGTPQNESTEVSTSG